MKKNNQYGYQPQFSGRVAHNMTKSRKTVKKDVLSEAIPLPRLLFRENQKIIVDEHSSQSYVLQDLMEEAKLSHGQTVAANLKNVRVDEKGILYFCPMEKDDLEILRQISAGDGNEIPDEVVLVGNFIIERLIPGHFNLKNVDISSNGSIQLIAQKETVWEKVTV